MGGISTQGLYAQNDLKITNLKITPTPKGVQTPTIELHMNRSYQVEVTVEQNGQVSQCFTVRTVCIKNNRTYTLGEARIGFAASLGEAYALYTIFPSSAGGGQCFLRTIVDANNEVAESDESALSNIWDRKTLILP